MERGTQEYAQVAVDAAVGKRLDYAVPDELRGRLRVGSRVWVPPGNRKAQGTITSLPSQLVYPKPKPFLRWGRTKVSAIQSSRGPASRICGASHDILWKMQSLRRRHG